MNPYQYLYIYEIPRAISDSKKFFQKDFIGCWNEGETSFLFFSHPHDEEVRSFTEKRRYPLASRNVLDYKAWQAGEELKPFKAGNLVIAPPWEEIRAEEGEILVHLDPSVVFGTGYHPTTRTCLKALWEIYGKERPKRVLDLGTGTGILAVAAAKWGAETVLAVDCNELAVATALRNVFANGESQRITVKMAKAEEVVEEEADLLCANIHRQIIESLLKKRAFFDKRWLILSGVFEKDGEEIERRLARRSVEVAQRLKEKNWLTLVGFNQRCK
ncbi:MAG TPA: 50S ribosomal protein L11 methyltransferase [Thermodesulfobacteriota bacterium]|nr:50S ribosomal protein L11 methyltransferase [Thermodesulfobacteriota bacterium]